MILTASVSGTMCRTAVRCVELLYDASCCDLPCDGASISLRFTAFFLARHITMPLDDDPAAGAAAAAAAAAADPGIQSNFLNFADSPAIKAYEKVRSKKADGDHDVIAEDAASVEGAFSEGLKAMASSSRSELTKAISWAHGGRTH